MKREDLRKRFATPKPIERDWGDEAPAGPTLRQLTQKQLREINGLDLMKCNCTMRTEAVRRGMDPTWHETKCAVWKAPSLNKPFIAFPTGEGGEQCPFCDEPGAFETLPEGKWHCGKCFREGKTIAELQKHLDAYGSDARPCTCDRTLLEPGNHYMECPGVDKVVTHGEIWNAKRGPDSKPEPKAPPPEVEFDEVEMERAVAEYKEKLKAEAARVKASGGKPEAAKLLARMKSAPCRLHPTDNYYKDGKRRCLGCDALAAGGDLAHSHLLDGGGFTICGLRSDGSFKVTTIYAVQNGDAPATCPLCAELVEARQKPVEGRKLYGIQRQPVSATFSKAIETATKPTS